MYQPQPQPQPQPLGGGYYGPPIPPQAYSQPRPRTCYCCLLSTLFKAVIAVCVAIGLTVLILWIVFRPTRIKVSVDHASLTVFNLTTSPTTPTLSYNLTTDVSIRNPNSKIGIYYDWLEADAYYDSMRFGLANLVTFYQGHKNTTVLHPAFVGSTAFVLGDSGVGDFQNANKTGAFDVDVWLFARVRYKFGSLITRRYFARVRCELRLPLLNNGSSNNRFTGTECDVVDF